MKTGSDIITGSNLSESENTVVAKGEWKKEVMS